MCGRPRLTGSRTAHGLGPVTGRAAALAAPSSPKCTFPTSPETETVR